MQFHKDRGGCRPDNPHVTDGFYSQGVGDMVYKMYKDNFQPFGYAWQLVRIADKEVTIERKAEGKARAMARIACCTHAGATS
jgi:hypothetical protein